MIVGRIEGNKPLVSVGILLPNQPKLTIEFVLDTGFAGFLTLPPRAVALLQLPYLQAVPSRLADGSRVMLESYLATISWAEREHPVEVIATGEQPLMGRALLQGSFLGIDFREGGEVIVEVRE